VNTKTYLRTFRTILVKTCDAFSMVRPIKSLTESVGAGAIELIINGSPAFRCVYVAKYADMVVVLHSFVKTTNGSDRHAMQVAEQRMKELKQELRKMGYRV